MNPNNIPVRELFGFERDPFRADPAEVWLDDLRQEALEQLDGLVGRGGFGVLTGPAGCGKTILLGRLCSRLGASTHRVIYVACTECGPADMLRLLCAGLDLEPSLGRSRMIRRVNDRVAEMKGITPVLVIDEAQSLPQPPSKPSGSPAPAASTDATGSRSSWPEPTSSSRDSRSASASRCDSGSPSTPKSRR